MIARLFIGLSAALVILVSGCKKEDQKITPGSGSFDAWMGTGKTYYDKGDAARAVPLFSQAVSARPQAIEPHLNLANAFLVLNQADDVIREADAALKIDENNPAANYLKGCALLRAGKFEDALKYLQTAKDIDVTVNPVSYQLGRAHQQLGHLDEAISEFREVVRFETNHLAAHYNLSQVLNLSGKTDEAQQEMAEHQRTISGQAAKITDPAVFERCKYTQALAVFKLEEPLEKGIPVHFVEITKLAFGELAGKLQGPVAILDFSRNGIQSLLVQDTPTHLLTLMNSNGVFTPGEGIELPGAVRFSTALVGDLNNDGMEDVAWLSTNGARIVRCATNGSLAEVTAASNLKTLVVDTGALMDFTFSGNLGLIGINSENGTVDFRRNLGRLYFSAGFTNMVGEDLLKNVTQLKLDDLNGDDLPDILVLRKGQPPLVAEQMRGGPFVVTNAPASWPAARAAALGDLNNDGKADVVLVTDKELQVFYPGFTNSISIPLTSPCSDLFLIDYDNDGWLDIFAVGEKVQVWRNLGHNTFKSVTQDLGLSEVSRVSKILPADFDGDGDTDLLFVHTDGLLSMYRNDGGNKNYQMKLRMVGTRSNKSGLGVRVDASAGGFRVSRRIQSLPIEIGLAQHSQLEALTVKWIALNFNLLDVNISSNKFITLDELQNSDTSCPYLYAWDGAKYRFVSDFLGAAPVGLPLFPGHRVESDPQELLKLGDDSNFKARDGDYTLQMTEELREVLYLDYAEIWVIDHPANQEVFSTSKLLPRGPFPNPAILVGESEHNLVHAETLTGKAVTTALLHTDQVMVSPDKLRAPQLRGLAEPHGIILDFGEIDSSKNYLLALTGWIRFGGATANISASQDPELPFPFPQLQVETSPNLWTNLAVTVGSPAGKTKTIVVDLTGLLPHNTHRFRLSSSFELHWDQIQLFEKGNTQQCTITRVTPTQSDLHWRGFGRLQPYPWFLPQTPIYESALQQPMWTATPGGWSTRYGNVDELLKASDDALVCINSGDELTLKFKEVPASPVASTHRDFFLYSVGWDKDGDYHVARGKEIEPFPSHGMNDQTYGSDQQLRPRWAEKYNTRWVMPFTLKRAGK
ncbi:MAG: Tetratricopeptide 2 repeat protein [Verrucomicrobiales bacterium]|nr:Tetratricopeptide 2 repeat protein [Verrucomicrobiales bacterium]